MSTKQVKLQEVRVRYSREDEDRTPKNTLYTHLQGNRLYFGIARCNAELDHFNKATGKHIANQRALKALQDDRFANIFHGNLQLHKSGLRGNVEKNNAKELIQYFRSVDAYLYDRAVSLRPNSNNELARLLEKQRTLIAESRFDDAPIKPASMSD